MLSQFVQDLLLVSCCQQNFEFQESILDGSVINTEHGDSKERGYGFSGFSLTFLGAGDMIDVDSDERSEGFACLSKASGLSGLEEIKIPEEVQ
jgi:hypothetical protein